MSPPTRALVLLCACGSCAPACGRPPADPANTFGAIIGSDLQAEHARDVLGFYLELVPGLDARRIDLAFAETWDEQHAACGWDAACTVPEVAAYSVTTVWKEDGGDSAAKNHAYALAHELCHVYYFEVGEHGDPNHTHAECFAAPGRPYGGGVGWAWQAAENF